MRPAIKVGLAGLLAILVAGAVALAWRPRAERSVFQLLQGETQTLLPGGGVAHRLEVQAARADITHLGAHVHTNWLVFALPFDTTRADLRGVTFAPKSAIPSDVGALRTPLGCIPTVSLGPIEGTRWARYTLGAIGGTLPFADNPRVPTLRADDLAINVPTRVANYAECYEPALRDASTWRLEIRWETTP